MTGNIIEFKSATAHRVSSVRTERAEPSFEALSPTAKNSRLRNKRKDAWRAADAVRLYWRARLDLNSAVGRVLRHDAPEGRDHPAVTPDDHQQLGRLIERAIEKDEAFLAAHPTRRPKRKAEG